MADPYAALPELGKEKKRLRLLIPAVICLIAVLSLAFGYFLLQPDRASDTPISAAPPMTTPTPPEPTPSPSAYSLPAAEQQPTSMATTVTTIKQTQPTPAPKTVVTTVHQNIPPVPDPSPAEAREPMIDQFSPLQSGDEGRSVKVLQRMLSGNGIRTYVDGIFGDATLRSVKQWQSQVGLYGNGIVDDNTWLSLLPQIRLGSSGYATEALQEALRSIGYDIVVDGEFGTQTDAAVREFQKSRGLIVDGLVGAQTWSSLLTG